MKTKRIFKSLAFILFCFTITFSMPHQQHQELDKQTQYIQQFAKTMADFIPTQTFTYLLQAGQQQNFILWPGVDVQKIRGVFYIDNAQDPEQVDGNGFFVGCEINGVIQKTFLNERLGVFTLNLKDKPSNVKLITKSDVKKMSIYLSYEMKKVPKVSNKPINTDQSVPTEQQQQLEQKKSQLADVSVKFSKVQTTVQSQQNSLRMILKHIGKNSKRLQGNLKYAHYRIITQTLVVVLSSLFGMWLIKKQMNSGYQLLV